MNTKRLIISVLGIFIIAGGLYTIISPRATRVLDSEIDMAMPITNTTTTTTTANVVASTSAPVVAPTPKKAPVIIVDPAYAPVPAPEPEIEPAPKNSFTASDVAMNNSASSCWSIINGSVYDLTSYVSKHPGGERNILKICGKDGSDSFDDQHGGESRPEKILINYRIGELR